MTLNFPMTQLSVTAPLLALSLTLAACNRGSNDDSGNSTPSPQGTPDTENGKAGDKPPALQLTEGGVTLTIKVDRALASGSSDESSVLMTRQVDVGDFDSAAIYVLVDSPLAAQSCYLYYNKQYRVRRTFQKFSIRTLFGMDEKTFAASSYDFAFDGSHLGMTTDGKLASVVQIPALPGKFLTLWIDTLENGSVSRDQSGDVPAPVATTSSGSGNTTSISPTPTPQPVDNTPDCKGEIQFRVYGKRKV